MTIDLDHIRRGILGLALSAVTALATATSVPAATPADDAGAIGVRELRVERIEVEGNSRTPAETIETAAALHAGEVASPEAILDAANRLRRSHLVREVKVHTRRGSVPGQIVVVFAIEETRAQVRLGLGFGNVSGWYLIPVQLNLDNVSGHAEEVDLSVRFGFRTFGVIGRYRRPALEDPRRFWELLGRAEGVNRLYFYEGTEVGQSVAKGGLDFRLGRPLDRRFALEGWATVENVVVDSTATRFSGRSVFNREEGETIAFEDLPPSIQGDVGQRAQTRFGLSLGVDTRRGSGVATRGFWGRTYGEFVLSDRDTASFAGWRWDLRGYTRLGRGVSLAARTQAGAISRHAPFFERFYLGGLYTIRGYPNQSLSPPGGHLAFATGSIELRNTWIGDPRNPLLVGFLFIDAGMGWNRGLPELNQGSIGVGYGLSVRLPWIDRLGVSVGAPVTGSPVDEAFRVNLSIGWTY